MSSQLLRASCNGLARATRAHPAVIKRTFITPTTSRQADLVQNMYLSALKDFKPTPIKPGDAEGHVLKFSAPKPPKSPEEANLAGDLKAYESMEVEVEGQASAGEASGKVEDWFEEEVEEEHKTH